MVTRIYTNPTNQPEYIPIQKLCFTKYLKDPFEFVVLSHASDPEISSQIAQVCEEENIEHHILEKRNIPQINNIDHSMAVQNTFDEYCLKDKDVSVIIHNDMFLFKPFSFKEYLGENVISAVYQERGKDVHYLSSHMLVMDMARLPNKESMNMNCGVINGEHVDVCGHTYYWLKQNPTAPVKWMELEWLSDDRTRKEYLEINGLHTHYDPTFSCEIHGKSFLHYARGTNWDKKDDDWVKAKRMWFKEWCLIHLL